MAKLDGPCFYQVDAHNVVPVWETSDQQENTPRDIRKKIMCKLGQFLTEFPPVVKHPVDTAYPCKVRYFSLPFPLLRPYYTAKRTIEILISNIHLLSPQN